MLLEKSFDVTQCCLYMDPCYILRNMANSFQNLVPEKVPLPKKFVYIRLISLSCLPYSLSHLSSLPLIYTHTHTDTHTQLNGCRKFSYTNLNSFIIFFTYNLWFLILHLILFKKLLNMFVYMQCNACICTVNWIKSFFHSFSKYSLSTCSVSRMVLPASGYIGIVDQNKRSLGVLGKDGGL